MDNRCGVAALLRTMDLLSTCEHEVVVLFSVQEELGCIGAAGAIDKNPDLAIVVDVTHGMTPDGSVERSFPLGSGVAVCTGPNIHRSFFQRILETAQKEGISYTIAVSYTHLDVYKRQSLILYCILFFRLYQFKNCLINPFRLRTIITIYETD